MEAEQILKELEIKPLERVKFQFRTIGIEAVIFDLFGTIVKQHQGSQEEFKACLVRALKPDDPMGFWKEWVRRQHEAIEGVISYEEFLRTVGKFTDVHELDLQVTIDDVLRETWPPNDGVFNTLNTLSNRGIRLALLTNSIKDWVDNILDELSVLEFLDPVVISSEIKSCKPAPKGYRYTLKLLGTEAENTLYVGDEVEDLKGAKAIGLKTGFLPGQDQDCGDFSPDFRFRDLLDLRNQLRPISQVR